MSNAKDPFIEIPAGTAVFRQGDAGHDMYIVESGQIDIVYQAGGDEDALATLGPGDFFGEMAMLEDQPRSASARATTKSRLLRIERAAFADVLKQNVEIAVRIMRKLVARERHIEQRLHAALAELKKAKAAPASAKADAAAPIPSMPAAPPARPAPAAAAPNLALRLVDGGQTLALDAARSEFLVGRPDPVTGTQPEVNLGPYDSGRSLSRRHAKILREGSLYFVREEVGTSNGTFVNGERLKTGVSAPLKPGDKLRFGSIEVELVIA